MAPIVWVDNAEISEKSCALRFAHCPMPIIICHLPFVFGSLSSVLYPLTSGSFLHQSVRSDIVDIFIVIKGNHQINPLQIICDLT